MSAASYTTQLMHARGFNLALALLAVTAATLFFLGGNTEPINGDRGFAFTSANEWFTVPAADFSAGIGASVFTVLIMLLINRIHNVFRAMTSLFIGMFAMMQMGTPGLMTQFSNGSLMAVVVPLCILFLLRCYGSPRAARTVFLVFFILSAALLTQYSFVFYFLVMAIGCMQMRVFNWRNISAATLGIISPWWIVFGFGLVNPFELQLPHLSSILVHIHQSDMLLMLIAVGFTVLITAVCFILSVMRTIAYNAHARAVNGVFTITTMVTVAALCIDNGNMTSYVPLLNFCAAMEVTHYFSTHRAEKSFIAILLIFAAYAALAICQTIISA